MVPSAGKRALEQRCFLFLNFTPDMELLIGQQNEQAIKWMQQTAAIAVQAKCLNAKCGTIILKDGEIIGTGYNAPPLDKEENRMCLKETGPGKPKFDRTCCVHAEWRAIM